jgi:hypothetical protein
VTVTSLRLSKSRYPGRRASARTQPDSDGMPPVARPGGVRVPGRTPGLPGESSCVIQLTALPAAGHGVFPSTVKDSPLYHDARPAARNWLPRRPVVTVAVSKILVTQKQAPNAPSVGHAAVAVIIITDHPVSSQCCARRARRCSQKPAPGRAAVPGGHIPSNQ